MATRDTRAPSRAASARPGGLRDLLAARELIVNMSLREIRTKYRRTALGQGWSLLNPVFQIATYAFVFSFVLRIQPPPGTKSGLDVFVLWLSSAIIPWLFFTNVLNTSIGALVGSSELIKKNWFPRESLVLAVLASCVFTFVIEMVVLHVAIVIAGGTVKVSLVAITLLLMVLLAIFALGLGLLLSVVNVYFRDTQHLVSLVLQAWFYATAIFYPLSLISTRMSAQGLRIYRLNPMERFAEAFRDSIYNGVAPSGLSLLVLGLSSAVVLTLGHAVFRRLEGRLAEEL